MEEGFLGGGALTQQILPRLLPTPADGKDMPVPDVCHLSRNMSLQESFYIYGFTESLHPGYDGSHRARRAVRTIRPYRPIRDHTGRASTNVPTFSLEFLGPVLAFSSRGAAVTEQDGPMPRPKWIIKSKEEVKSLPLGLKDAHLSS